MGGLEIQRGSGGGGGGGSDISVRAFHSATQSIANNTFTVVALNSEDFDTDTMHDPSTNNERITFTTAGKYIVCANIGWNPDAGGGWRELNIRKNGSSWWLFHTIDSTTNDANTIQSTSAVGDFAADDYIEIRVRQNSGNSVNLLAGSNNISFSAAKILG